MRHTARATPTTQHQPPQPPQPPPQPQGEEAISAALALASILTGGTEDSQAPDPIGGPTSLGAAASPRRPSRRCVAAGTTTVFIAAEPLFVGSGEGGAEHAQGAPSHGPSWRRRRHLPPTVLYGGLRHRPLATAPSPPAPRTARGQHAPVLS